MSGFAPDRTAIFPFPSVYNVLSLLRMHEMSPTVINNSLSLSWALRRRGVYCNALLARMYVIALSLALRRDISLRDASRLESSAHEYEGALVYLLRIFMAPSRSGGFLWEI